FVTLRCSNSKQKLLHLSKRSDPSEAVMRKTPNKLWSRKVVLSLLAVILLSFDSGCIVRPWGHRHHHHRW
ncbi:MAG TPA: hypothetical protein PK472_13775, partial [Pseudomonadota bacterium]|nr:hypothetical protein [Pseudomonadota bacterium]